MDDPVAVTLERRAEPTRFFFTRAPARVIGTDGKRGEPPFLVLAHAKLEGVSNTAGKLGHEPRLVVHPAARDGRIAGSDPSLTPTLPGIRGAS